jgi:Asp-tRNA(Asn)/Glu-tRNA(Gln) amidotransferase A subunit family amidase
MRINTETLDTVGIMARAVGDIALFRAAMMAIPYEPPSMPQSAPRLGLCRAPHWDEAQPEGRAVLEAAADRLASAGAMIRETELPHECTAGDEIQHASARSRVSQPMPDLPPRALLSRLRDGKIARASSADVPQGLRSVRRARAAARWAAASVRY